jgi:predicted CoA-binding protein
MQSIAQAAKDFLSKRRIAVTGVSRSHPQEHGGNAVYRHLRAAGYEVFAVNPNADEVEGDRCFHDLEEIPRGVDAVVIATSPTHADETMRRCAELGIRDVWMHRGTGAGSVSATAAAFGREHDIRVIDGGCPLMFLPKADPGHRLMLRIGTWTGRVPRQV